MNRIWSSYFWYRDTLTYWWVLTTSVSWLEIIFVCISSLKTDIRQTGAKPDIPHYCCFLEFFSQRISLHCKKLQAFFQVVNKNSSLVLYLSWTRSCQASVSSLPSLDSVRPAKWEIKKPEKIRLKVIKIFWWQKCTNYSGPKSSRLPVSLCPVCSIVLLTISAGQGYGVVVLTKWAVGWNADIAGPPLVGSAALRNISILLLTRHGWLLPNRFLNLFWHWNFC